MSKIFQNLCRCSQGFVAWIVRKFLKMCVIWFLSLISESLQLSQILLNPVLVILERQSWVFSGGGICKLLGNEYVFVELHCSIKCARKQLGRKTRVIVLLWCTNSLQFHETLPSWALFKRLVLIFDRCAFPPSNCLIASVYRVGHTDMDWTVNACWDSLDKWKNNWSSGILLAVTALWWPQITRRALPPL